LPGAHLLDGRFTAVQQSMGVKHDHAAAVAYLTAFTDEVTSSGLLREIIERHDVRGLSIVTPPSR
jgi:polar amino acid transport system substrate-binding protein